MKCSSLLLACSLAASALTLSSCGSDEPQIPNTKRLIATWKLSTIQGWKVDSKTGVRNNWDVQITGTSDTRYRELTFYANGTYVENGFDEASDGSWGIVENGLYWASENTTSQQAANGEERRCTYTLNGSALTMTERNAQADLVTTYKMK